MVVERWHGCRSGAIGQRLLLLAALVLSVYAPSPSNGADVTPGTCSAPCKKAGAAVDGPAIIAHPGDRFGAAGSDRFGSAVAVLGDWAVVGIPLSDTPRGFNAGAALVFHRMVGGWVEHTRLIPSEGGDGDGFGSAVALTQDRIVVGAPGANIDDAADAGTAYVFERDADTWIETARLRHNDPAEGDGLGIAIAISADTAVIGASGKIGGGAAYSFSAQSGVWSQDQKLLPEDASALTYFGSGLSLDGDVLLVSAPWAASAPGVLRSGAVYVFERTGDAWLQQSRLVAPGPAAGDAFGTGLALRGNTALIGAPGVDLATQNGGAAFVFQFSGGGWTLDATLLPDDASSFTDFGTAVVLSDNGAEVSAPRDSEAGLLTGAVYRFQPSGANWLQRQKITYLHADPNGSFGQAIAASGNTLWVGAPFAEAPNQDATGAVEIFSESSGEWTSTHVLALGTTAQGDRFGQAIAASAGTLLVGAPGENAALERNAGSAYVFVRDGAGFALQAPLRASDAAELHAFGQAVAIDTYTAAIGAPYRGNGAVYLFERHSGVWTETAILQSPDDGPATGSDQFGSAIALTGDTLLIGAPEHSPDLGDGLVSRGGAVYVFRREGGSWQYRQKLASPLPDHQFGAALALHGSVAVIGAPSCGAGEDNRGRVYSFHRAEQDWQRQQTLPAPLEQPCQGFGRALGLTDQHLLVGAPDSERAWIYERIDEAWQNPTALQAPEPLPASGFGTTVALTGEHAFVGSTQHRKLLEPSISAAHHFRQSNGGWRAQRRLVHLSGYADQAGAPVVIDGLDILIGAPHAAGTLSGNVEVGQVTLIPGLLPLHSDGFE